MKWAASVRICMLVLLCKYACLLYGIFLYEYTYILGYTREGILFHRPIFCISSIRDGYTKWVRYRIIVEAAAVLLSILLIIDARHCREELGKPFLLFF